MYVFIRRMIIELGRRQRKKAVLRQRIVQVAMGLFRQHGFSDTKMEQIAHEVDIAKATLYKYFPVKDAIVAAYWQVNTQEKTDMLPLLFEKFPNTKSRVKAVFISAINKFKEEPEFARIQFAYQFQEIARNPENQTMRSGFEALLQTVLQQGQQDGDVRTDIDAAVMSNQLLFLFTSTCLLWFSNMQLFPIEERLNQLVTLFIEGVGYE